MQDGVLIHYCISWVGIQLVFIDCIIGCLNRWFSGRFPVRDLKIRLFLKNVMCWLVILLPNVWFAQWVDWEQSSVCPSVLLGSQIVCECIWWRWAAPFVTKCPYCWKPRGMTGRRKIWEQLIIKFKVSIKSTDSLKSQEVAVFKKLSFANCVLTFKHTAVILIKITWRTKPNVVTTVEFFHE